MASATARAPKPAKQKGRPGKSGLSIVHVNSNIDADISNLARLQFLARVGLPTHMAMVLAPLVWEVRHG